MYRKYDLMQIFHMENLSYSWSVEKNYGCDNVEWTFDPRCDTMGRFRGSLILGLLDSIHILAESTSKHNYRAVDCIYRVVHQVVIHLVENKQAMLYSLLE